MWDLSSATKGWTRILCIARQILSHWTTREVSSAFKNNFSPKYCFTCISQILMFLFSVYHFFHCFLWFVFRIMWFSFQIFGRFSRYLYIIDFYFNFIVIREIFWAIFILLHLLRLDLWPRLRPILIISHVHLKRKCILLSWAGSLVAQLVKNLPAMQETLVWSLGREVPLETG